MTACPETTQLRRLEAGELDDGEADVLLPHVSCCAACADTLEKLRRESMDTRVLRTALRESDRTHAAANAAPGGMLDPPAEAWSSQTETLRSPDGAPPPRVTHDGARDLAAQWRIPDYERVRLCGEGAFGTVWAVRDRVGVYRALKTIDISRTSAQKARCRESTALEAYCRLVGRHPNLIEVFHVGVQGDLLYYTMELADDDRTRKTPGAEFPADYRPLTLERVIARGPIRVDTAMDVVLRLLRGLSKLHAAGLAHRDIKPSNVVFVGRQPKLADIGMITTETATPSQVGTPAYMPPDRRMDPTADVFAMGRMLFELIAGRACKDFPRLPSSALRGADKWDVQRVQAVLRVACADAAEDRYPHASRMLEELEACRELPYESLFGDLAAAEKMAAPQTHPYRPYILAAIHALPWVLGLTLAIVLAQKLL